jgi:iron-sulfur cluster repair protein YtfE (RIC family)
VKPEIALRLQRADEAQTETVRHATLDFWNSECREHFRLEEELLLPALARHAGADDPDIQRILAEHADLRRRIAELDAKPDTKAEVLNRLGKLLSDHVRYEERIVFGRIEATLAPDELDAIGGHLHAAGNEHRAL